MRPLPSVDVYLLPAIVGGGLGDIDEVLTAGRRLSDWGIPIVLFRHDDRPLPSGTTGPWAWPPHRRVTRLQPSSTWAMTLSASWGIVAAPPRSEPYGRPGPWSNEAAEIEQVYGADRTMHVSFEEFARTLTSREQTIERWREGGVPWREIRRRVSTPSAAREIAAFHREYAKFRGFQRSNVLHLFTTFRYSRPFAREFPEAIQTGPLWPKLRAERAPIPRRSSGRSDWVWYASPSSSDRLLPSVLKGLAKTGLPVSLWYRTPRRFPGSRTESVRVIDHMLPARTWHSRFAQAQVRIVTGSRTLLEAVQLKVPFLYFNGITGQGRRTHRHRPEKIRCLLSVWRKRRVSSTLLRDLDSFSRARSVESVVGRAAKGSELWSRFPRILPVEGFQWPYDDAAGLLRVLVSGLTRNAPSSAEVVRIVRDRQLGQRQPRLAERPDSKP